MNHVNATEKTQQVLVFIADSKTCFILHDYRTKTIYKYKTKQNGTELMDIPVDPKDASVSKKYK